MIKPDDNWYMKVKIPKDSSIKITQKEIDKTIKELRTFGSKADDIAKEAKTSIWLSKKRASDEKKYPGATTSEEYEKIHDQKNYCKPMKCFEVDKIIPNEQLDNINKNNAISVTYTCAGHEEKRIKYPHGKLTEKAIGLETQQTPSIIGFETRFESNLCPAIEKNILNTICKSEDSTMSKYMIESTKPDPKNNAKWWDNASKVLGSERFILDNIDKKKRTQIEEFKLMNY